jgi:prepilin-type N-terminal cleavage/methylation domain-containing protein
MTKRSARNIRHKAAFTLIEMLISMMLISVAISVFLQASEMFGDRLQAIIREAETRTAMMLLASFLDDAADSSDMIEQKWGVTPLPDYVQDVPGMHDAHASSSEQIMFWKDGRQIMTCVNEGVYLQCYYPFPGETEIVMSSLTRNSDVFRLAEHGFVNAQWIRTEQNDVATYSLEMTEATGKKFRLDFGIFSGIRML